MKLIPSEIEVKQGGYITVVFGDKGTGKSSFCVDTADVSEPLFYANFDKDVSMLLHKYKGAYIDYELFHATDNKAVALATLAKFKAMLNRAISVGSGVFAIDNGAALWDLIKKAYLPEKADNEKIFPKEFGDANSYHREVCQTLEYSNLWPIFTAPAVEIWKGQSTGTGLFKAEGWKHLDLEMTNCLYLFTPGRPEGVPHIPTDQNWAHSYKGIVVDAKLNPVVQGTVLDNPRFKELLDATT